MAGKVPDPMSSNYRKITTKMWRRGQAAKSLTQMLVKLEQIGGRAYVAKRYGPQTPWLGFIEIPRPETPSANDEMETMRWAAILAPQVFGGGPSVKEITLSPDQKFFRVLLA